MKKKVVPKLRQGITMKVDIVTSDDIKIYCTGKFQDFTARYIINSFQPSIPILQGSSTSEFEFFYYLSITRISMQYHP